MSPPTRDPGNLPAWLGPLHCGGCDRIETLVLDPAAGPEYVRCIRCGWTGDVWESERRTLEDVIDVAGGERPPPPTTAP